MTSPHSCRSVSASNASSTKRRQRSGRIWGTVVIVLIAVIACLGYVVMQRQAEQKKLAAAATRLAEIEPIITLAQKLALTNEEVTAAVGEKPTTQNPESLDAVGSEINQQGTSVNVDLVGSKSTVKLNATAKFEDGSWKLTKLIATLPDGSKKDIPPAADDAPPELNFDTGN